MWGSRRKVCHLIRRTKKSTPCGPQYFCPLLVLVHPNAFPQAAKGHDVAKALRWFLFNHRPTHRYGSNSLVTIATSCDERSSPSYIKYHLVGLKPHFIGHVK